MPTYEYQCQECGKEFEAFQKMSDSPLKQCKFCGGSVRRLISGGTGVIFKGSGFYCTDYKSKPSPAKKEKKEKKEQSAETPCQQCPAGKNETAD